MRTAPLSTTVYEGAKLVAGTKLVRSPLFYVGDKYKLMPQLKALFPENIKTFYDVFCGGGSASINVEADKFVMNDVNHKVIELHHHLQNNSVNIEGFIQKMYALIEKYGLSLSEKGKSIKIEELKTTYVKTYFSKYNKESYFKLRDDYNNDQSNTDLLYLLLIYGFNHMIRFNGQGRFNLPVGNVDWNKNVSKALENYASWYNRNDITLSSGMDFEDFVESRNLKPGDFLYFDPPYLITSSDYNKLWNEEAEHRLYVLLDRLTKKGIYWGLSNMVSCKGKRNEILLDWAQNYNEYQIESNYISRFDNTVKKDSKEIYVTNYDKPNLKKGRTRSDEMFRGRSLERKPLSFSTTMRNPMRIAAFLHAMLPYEGKILNNLLIESIVKDVLKAKIYATIPEKRDLILKSILSDSEQEFSDAQLERIIEISPQNHKEAGFDKGWPSRFDTWYKLPKEFGFVFYKMGEKIEISEAGKLLAETSGVDDDSATRKISNIFMNALAKYQTNNPFRRNLIDNAPFILLLETIERLRNDYTWDKTGIYRWEIPFVTCWPNADASELASYIDGFRNIHGKIVSNEVVYEACLGLLKSNNRTRFKIDQITKEGVDDFIRKLRITGLISLRGMGRLIDINKFEKDRAKYLIENYAQYKLFENEYEYYQYAGAIDHNIIDIISNENEYDMSDIKKTTLEKWASETDTNTIDEELRILGMRNGSSKHELLKYIDRPTRFEFLTSIALKQQFPEIDVIPNYAIDDEGMPTFTARGGVGDIEVFSKTDDVLVEVTLMQNKSQAVNEIPGITRHLGKFGDHDNKQVYSLFIAPTLHPDTIYMIEFTSYKEKLEINGYTISDFTGSLRRARTISDMRTIIK